MQLLRHWQLYCGPNVFTYCWVNIVANWEKSVFDVVFPLASFPDDSTVTKCGVAHELVSPSIDAADDDIEPSQVAYTRPWHVSISWVSECTWSI